MTPSRLAHHLRTLQLVPAVRWLQGWTRAASYAKVCAWIEATPEDVRDRLVVLLRDVLAGYPEVQHGYPVLVKVERHAEALAWPLPTSQPSEVISMRWVSPETLFDRGRFGRLAAPALRPNRLETAVLIVATRTPDPIVLDDAFWGELFDLPGSGSASVHLAGGECFPRPDAIEAACRLQAIGRTGDVTIETPHRFLSDQAWSWAASAACAWRHQLARNQP